MATIDTINDNLNRIDELSKDVQSTLNENIAARKEVYRRLIARGGLNEKQKAELEQIMLDEIKQKVKEAGTLDVLTPQQLAFAKKMQSGGDTMSTESPKGGKVTPIADYSDLDKEFAKQYGKIAPIANMPINPNQQLEYGQKPETPLSRLIDKVYGPHGYYAKEDDNGDTVIVNEATGEQKLPPTFELGESAKRFGISAAAQIIPTILMPQVKGGQILGQLARGALRTAGAGAGESGASVLNLKRATGEAQKLGLIKPEEDFFTREALPSAIQGLTTGAVGQGVLGEAIPGIASNASRIPKLSEMAKMLRIGGNTGREISRAKGAIASQAIVDELQQSVADIPGKATGVDAFGEAVKNVVVGTKKQLADTEDLLFNDFEKTVQKKIGTGNVQFVDATDAYKKLTDKINNATYLQPAEKTDLIDFIHSNFNAVKNSIKEGTLEVHPRTKTQFFPETTGGLIQPYQDQVFDPSKVTSLDLRGTLNAIQKVYEGKSPAVQSMLADLRSTIRQATGDSFTDTGDKSIASSFKVPTDELLRMKVAYKKAAEKYKILPDNLRKLTDQDLPSTFSQAAKEMAVEDASKLRKLVDQSPIDVQTQFTQGLRKDILTESKGVVREGAKIVDSSKLSPSIIKEAKALSGEEVGGLIDEGIKPDFGKLKQVIKDPTKEMVGQQETIMGKNIFDQLRLNPSQNILLGQEAEQLSNLGSQLKRYQQAAGVESNMPDMAAADKMGQAAQQTVDKFLPQGSVVSKVLSGAWNPMQRAGADILESQTLQNIVKPIQATTEFVGSPVGKLLGGATAATGSALINNPEDTQALIRRLLGQATFSK